MESDRHNVNEKNNSHNGETENVSVSYASKISENEILQNEGNESLNRKSKKRRILIATLIVAVMLLAGLLVYLLLQENDSSDNSSIDTTQAETIEEINVNEPVKKIYFAEGTGEDNLSVLYSVEPTTKELKTIDSGIVSGSGRQGFGSDTPLNSPDFYKVAYIKDESIWIAGDQLEPQKIDQPDVSTIDFYRLYLSAWSSDSKQLVFAVDFSCPEIHSTVDCSSSDENQELTGIFMHTMSSGETTKLPIETVEQWLPGTSKVVYLDENTDNNSSQMRTYDMENGKDEQLSAAPFGFGLQFGFSDDGSRLIYSQGVNGTQASEIVAADVDNSNQAVLISGDWADLQWPMFLSNSNQNYAYIHSIDEACPGGGGCPKSQLNLVLNGVENVIGDTRGGLIGNFGDYVVVLTGSSVYAYGEPYEVSINLENSSTERAESSIYSKAFDAMSNQDVTLRIGH